MQSEKMLTSPIASVIGTAKRQNRLDVVGEVQTAKKNTATIRGTYRERSSISPMGLTSSQDGATFS